MKNALYLGLVAGLVFVSGCVGTRASFQQDISSIENYDMTKGEQIFAEASGFQLLLFIPIRINTRFVRAQRQLMERANGGYVTDIKVQEAWTYAFAGTVYTTRLEAIVYPQK